jgi:hypothetical protein
MGGKLPLSLPPTAHQICGQCSEDGYFRQVDPNCASRHLSEQNRFRWAVSRSVNEAENEETREENDCE